MSWIEDNQDFLRKHPNIRNQWRSWEIMRMYFGVEYPNSKMVDFKIKWPDFMQDFISKIRIESNKKWEEYAKNN